MKAKIRYAFVFLLGIIWLFGEMLQPVQDITSVQIALTQMDDSYSSFTIYSMWNKLWDIIGGQTGWFVLGIVFIFLIFKLLKPELKALREKLEQ